MRRHLARVLRDRWDVVLAADGRQALEAARGHHPDLLVTDVMMPAVDGFGLVAAIRVDPELAPLPVIMLSARAGVEAAGEGLAAGADNYLIKPFSSTDLVNRVEARLKAAGRDRFAASHDELRAQRALALAELGTALGAARSADQALQALLASPLCSLDATAAALALLDAERGQLRIGYAGNIRAEAASRYHLVDMDAPVPMADVARQNQPMIVTGTPALDSRYAAFAADVAPEVRASIMHPLRAEDGSVLGVAGLAWAAPRQFSPDDIDISGQAAALLARAVARITVAEREHQIAVSFQERLLDLGTRSTAAVVAAAGRPAGQAARLGGDWYTATPIDEQLMSVSVGDVVGHGLAAAAVMSQLRSALGAAALAVREPGAVLDLLDRYARTLPEATFATVAYAIIDTAAGAIDYTCAGHPYPLIVTADGQARYLRDGRRPPLAARAVSGPAAAGRSALPAGSLLVLYTDGLIERRDEPLDDGFTRLAAAAARCAQMPAAAAACAALLDAMAGEHGYEDDVAIIAVRPAGTTPASHVDALRADFGELAPARARLRSWLEDLGTGPACTYSILASVGEALNNAIEHGSNDNPGRIIGIEAFAGQGVISATVTDPGRWSKDTTASGRGASRGRGLKLIHGLSDHVETVRTATGTRVTMTYRPDPQRRAGRRARA